MNFQLTNITVFSKEVVFIIKTSSLQLIIYKNIKKPEKLSSHVHVPCLLTKVLKKTAFLRVFLKRCEKILKSFSLAMSEFVATHLVKHFSKISKHCTSYLYFSRLKLSVSALSMGNCFCFQC